MGDQPVGAAAHRVAPTAERDLLATLPAPRQVPGALETIRAGNEGARTRLVVFDDDPTGSQAVHDVPVLTLATPLRQIAAAAAESHPAVFVLTNSRALDPPQAAQLASSLTGAVLAAASPGTDVRLVSRSDSTLRGHFPAETDAVCAAAAQAGVPFSGVLLCPAFPEAGRLTIGDVQWVRQGQALVPVSVTDYARDPAFAYSEPTLPEWVRARAGREAAQIITISLAELRLASITQIAGRLTAVTGGEVVVANAACAADLEVLCLALQQAEAAGARLLYRTAPSFVRVRAGLPPRSPLGRADIYRVGPPAAPGLTVVGSHVPLTSRQLASARARHRLGYVELDASEAATGGHRAAAEISRCAHALHNALTAGDAVLATSREVLQGAPGQGSLHLAREIAAAEAATIAAVLARRNGLPLRYVIAKGGITAAEIAVRALGIRRATVAGPLAAGQISVWLPEGESQAHAPFIVFPGNVGQDSTLADVLTALT
jgi:uncharacterized protein YgbK (DUF1537 family)